MRLATSVLGVLIASFCTSALADPYIGFRVLRSEEEANGHGRIGDSFTVEDTYWRANVYAGYRFKYVDLEVGGGPLGRRLSHNVSSTFDIYQDEHTNYLYGGLLPKYRIQRIDVHAIVALARVKMKSHEYGSNENGPNQVNITYATDTSPMLGVGLGYDAGKLAFRFDFYRIDHVAKSAHTTGRDIIVYALSTQYNF